MRHVSNQSALEFLKAIPALSVGGVITDPPFFTGITRDGGGFGRDPWEKNVSTMDSVITWTEPIVKEVARVLRPGGANIVMGSSQSLAAWELCAARAGLSWMSALTILWNTGKPRARNFGGLSTEVRWYTKPGAKHDFNSGDARAIYSNVLVSRKIPFEQRLHPAQKPVGITNFFVSLLTHEDDLVVDPFCGSGSTLVSAELAGRPWMGCDNSVDPDYAGVAQRRARMALIEPEPIEPVYLWVNNKLIPIEG